MAPVELFRKIATRPFEPFRIVLSDGSGHDVTHPEQIAVGTRTTILGQVGEKDVRLDNLHVTQVLPLTPAPAKPADSDDEGLNGVG
jgi:hypothetical protein